MIYYDSQCTSLKEGLRILHSIPNLIFSYRQMISLANPYHDITYKPYFNHNIIDKIITLSFPSEYTWIANLRNTHDCKMVTYYKDVAYSYIKEITITPSMNIKICPDTTIIIYTKGRKDIDISFDAYLMKPASHDIMAKL